MLLLLVVCCLLVRVVVVVVIVVSFSSLGLSSECAVVGWVVNFHKP